MKIKEIISTIKKLIDYAFYDELTKCLNRRGLKWRIEEFELFSKKNKEKRKETHALILVDIDNLKYVNDNFGYYKGDKLIKTIALNLKRNFRKEDLICRWGGDEFLIIAMHIKKKRFIKRLKEIKKDINSNLKKLYSGISIGFSFFEPSNNFKKTFEKANKELKKDKKKKIIKVKR
jgi:diguanylate cyclase (GGDEF)-like protein